MWVKCAVILACIGHYKMVHRGVLHPTKQSNNFNKCEISMAGMPSGVLTHHA
jgi:hypothetical protein